MKKEAKLVVILILALLLASCSVNPFSTNNHLSSGAATGALVGAGAGAGLMALLGGSRTMIVAGGITGAAVGYYASTLRADAGPIFQSGGQVYQLGEIVGIYLPSYLLFEPNTADLLPCARPILDSAAIVLQRYPNNNIIISGNTSGFYRSRWEQCLSEKRAQVISAYFWNAGINDFKFRSNDTRRLIYVGYGDYFPISNVYTNKGIRQNSRIQIVSYPIGTDLLRRKNYDNLASMD